ncbi:MAG: Ldh family oxidoreductase [Acidimicrobiales bacterium]
MVESRFTVPDDLAIRVDEADMRYTVEQLFQGCGLPEADAAQAADTLLYADLRGIDSHGVSNMFPHYLGWLDDGTVNPTPAPRVLREAAAVATIDDDAGLGLVTGPRAMDLAIAKAAECGIGAVSVTNGRHYGAASYHAHRAVPHGMVGVSMTIGGLQVLPTFGARPMVGLNPISIAVTGGDEAPFVFDASMSSVAGNKIRIARRLGATVAPGWIADGDGRPILTESTVPDEFFMLPSGGTRDGGSHKGYSLAVMVDILCGVLGGDPPGFLRPRADVSHHFLAYRIDAFCDPDDFASHMAQFLKGLRETPPAEGHDRVLYAGLAEHETEQDRRRHGIPYHRNVVAWFAETAAARGVSHRLPVG